MHLLLAKFKSIVVNISCSITGYYMFGNMTIHEEYKFIYCLDVQTLYENESGHQKFYGIHTSRKCI